MKTLILKTLSFLHIKKQLMYLSSIILHTLLGCAQPYDDFEGNAIVDYDLRRSGQFKILKNPEPNNINSSEKCARYVRTNQPYDNFKIFLNDKKKLDEVNAYATYEGMPPKLRMKVYTNAPVGTVIEIQFAKYGAGNYPEAVHSQYQARTTVSGQWEELEFHFAQKPEGSKITENDINEIVVLFNPGSGKRGEIYYFDELSGPPPTEAKRSKKN